MEENIKKEIGFKQEHEKISKTYSRIYTIIFKYALSILGIVASFFVSNQIIKSNYIQNISIFPDRDHNIAQKENLVKEYLNEINQTIDSKDISIEIILGKLYTQGDFLYSKDNLIKFKGFIMPKLFKVEKNAPINDITYFDNDSYDIIKLEEFIKNIIFIDKDNLKFEANENKQLSLGENIEKTFNLSCLFESKITDKMCNYYISEFLKYFFVYNLKADLEGLKKIDNRLLTTPQYKEFCKGIKNYIIYSNDSQNSLEEIIENCGNTQSIDEFNKIKSFIEIQKELNEGYIKDKYYPYKDLNSYKLLSFQQILYNDISTNKIDSIRLSNYINFLKNLIKKNNIEQFYKEEIYRFNNYFLIKSVEESKKDNLFSITKDLYSINKGESIFGIPGLSSQIKNKKLETYLKNDVEQDHNITQNISGNETSMTETLLQSLYDLSFFTITQSKIKENDLVSISGYFYVGDKEIKTSLMLNRQQNNLIIKNINLQKYSGLTNVINNLIEKEDWGINKVYQYIVENLERYGNDNEEKNIGDIGFCDIIESRIASNIIECSNQRILVEKDGINYKIFIEKEKITNVEISDKIIEDAIKNQIQQSGYNNMSIFETIQGILNYKTEEKIEITGNQNSILISEIFGKYLGTKPDDLVESNGLFYIEFKLSDVNFISEFDLKTKTITALYFQDILLNGRQLKIKDFSIRLEDSDKERLNQFTIDPINYIKKLDSFSYLNYENKFGKKK